MSDFIYVCNNRWKRFFVLDLFSNELVPCSEYDFNELVIKYRRLYDVEYVSPNIRNFYFDGRLEARCER